MTTISAAEANRHFSHLLRRVRAGETVIVTSRGTPVATISPADRSVAVQATARDLLLARLRVQPTTDIGRWTRDELYEDEP